MASFNEVTRTAGRRRVTDRLPYAGAGIDALATQVGAILKVEQDAQRIILDVTKSYIHVEKFVKGAVDPDADQERYDNILRNVPMREFLTDKKLSPFEYIYRLFKEVTDEGLSVALIFAGNMVWLDRWIPLSKKEPKLLGIPVRRIKNIPEDALIVCGAEWVEAEPEDIRFTVKGAIS